MSSEVVENLITGKFHCHNCKRDMTSVHANFKCPNCDTGFVEIVSEPSVSSSGSSQRGRNARTRPYRATRMTSNTSGNNGLDLEDLIMTEIQRRRSRNDFATPRTRAIRFDPARESNILRRLQAIGSHGTGLGDGRREPALDNLVDEFMSNFLEGAHQFMQSVSGGSDGDRPLFLVGNTEDYAWGREGFDSIISQLLSQIESSGPPPLPSEQIQRLPSTSVTREQIDANMQCSICWEVFQLSEPVRKLPCHHIYHQACIVPWLELHATCPICRKSLLDNTQANSRNGGEGSSGGVNPNLQIGLETLLRNLESLRQQRH